MSQTAATILVRGRLGQDPELRFTNAGQAVCNFSLAVDQGYGDNQRTEWVRVAVWGEKQAEAANKFLSKGDLVAVTSSRFRINAYLDRAGNPRANLEVTADKLDYLITKRNGSASADDSDEFAEEDVPF